ncbi:exosortase N [Chitinophaga rhizophila]|uniref:Exosortase N n=1 Tax=Chitinophaga rhizophila TaxID=2866212 RepID=A0ABS7GK20_9BACT|nr:exosortase N [Chitinophaga rhizophila]MBW8687455.1 exosortase N [Chitinophaga rhizophila]
MTQQLYKFSIRLLHLGRCWPLAAVLCYMAVLYFGLQQYIIWSGPGTILGIVALCMVTTFNAAEKGSLRFLLVASFATMIYLVMPAKTLLFIAVVGGLFFLAETFYGRVNALPVCVFIVMSPLFEYVMNVFSFPLRLQLTQWAGAAIAVMGEQVTVQGNMIVHNGTGFSVDPACMGLQMMVTSLLCGIMLVGLYQRRERKTLPLKRLLPLLGIFLLLNIFSNLLRIVFLVWLHIMPDTFMHDMAGMMCLGLYVIVPAVYLTRWTVSRYGQPLQLHRRRYVLRSAVKMFALNTLLPLCILTACVIRYQQGPDNVVPPHAPALAGFNVTPMPGNIIRLQSDSLLVYIKHIPASYYTEHHPMICWKGSGYNFHKVQQQPVNEHTIYTALLQQEQAVLYTAWWYDNGLVITNSQLQWRWDVLFGAHPYSLVNVTAATEEQLQLAVREMLDKRLLSVYL